MIDLEPKDMAIQDVYRYLVGGIGPRPIALVSTLSKEGQQNLAPYSFFNAFGANPPLVAFSPTRRIRDGSVKDTYQNLLDTGECVVQTVSHAIVEQVNLTSIEFSSGIDEFGKSGLTPLDSDLVKARRVKESPFQMECKLWKMVPLGEEPGSGNLAICEILKFHIKDEILKDGEIDPDKMDLVGRMGGDLYSRASGDALFKVPRISGRLGMGYDGLPDFIKHSHIYTGNNLGRFATAENMPAPEEVAKFISRLSDGKDTSLETFEKFLEQGKYEEMVKIAHTLKKQGHRQANFFLEKTARCALERGNLDFAWKVALYARKVQERE